MNISQLLAITWLYDLKSLFVCFVVSKQDSQLPWKYE